jgi:hypothetical protein
MKKVQVNIITVTLILFSIVPMYKLKSRVGINLFNGPHTPELIEKWTGGLIKAEWIDRNYIPQI